MKNKIIIANSGRSNQGKTTSIKLTIQEILKQFPNANINEEIKDTGDINVIITIETLKIGIESHGDIVGNVKNSLNDFVEKKCDIIICACRTRGEPIKAVYNFGSKGYDIIWVTNPRSNKNEHHNFLNTLFVNQVVSIVKDFINKNK